MPSNSTPNVTTSADGTVEQIDGRYVLRFERRLRQSREKVWDARPDRMREWLGGEGDIELELAEGGKYHARTTGPPELVEAIIAEGGEEALTRHDTVLRVEPPTVFEHTFGDPDSVVRWELQTDGDGCRLKLTHTEPPDFAISEHGPRDLAGWHTLLEQLTQVLDGTATGWSKERWEELRDEYAAKWS